MISSLGKNPEREKVIDFTNAYAPFFNDVWLTSLWRGLQTLLRSHGYTATAG